MAYNEAAVAETPLEESSSSAGQHQSVHLQGQSPSVEMSQLPPQDQKDATPKAVSTVMPESTPTQDTIPSLDGTPALPSQAKEDVKGKSPLKDRAASEAIGPHTEDAPAMSAAKMTMEAGPAVLISIFLLNGRRHLFNVDQKYLRKRNIAKEGEGVVDPFGLSVYTIKELIWRDWRDDWDPRPTNPGAIRLIFFGKLLADNQTLRDARFKESNTPNVVHMSVKPQEFLDDEENAKDEPSSTRGANVSWDSDGRQAGCCRCTIM